MDWHQLWTIAATPDNVPIVGLVFLLGFFTWLAMEAVRRVNYHPTYLFVALLVLATCGMSAYAVAQLSSIVARLDEMLGGGLPAVRRPH